MGKIKCPLTYYGGKQQLAGRILKLMPEHEGYVEPFTGGAAVFWAKQPSKWEVLNDTNRELMNFYEQVKLNFASLEKEIRISLHSREMHLDAQSINERPGLHSPIKRAWALWFRANTSFAGKLNDHFGYDRSGQTSKKLQGKRDSFSEDLAIRLQNVQIESTDALRIIRSRDTAQTFFYCDPPYIGTNCGHYDGYSKADYEELLQNLAGIEGKFLLSSYPTSILTDYAAKNGWYQIEIEMGMSVAKGRKKVEVLTANYPISGDMLK